jgi:diguanylate cyclase (GGDEF)-like protein/PAS domain S-box-containing protein
VDDRPNLTGVLLLASLAGGLGVVLWLSGWPHNLSPEFLILIAGATLVAAFATPAPTTRDWVAVPPSFVVEFCALLLVGAEAALLVVVAGVVTSWLTEPPATQTPRRRLLHGATRTLAVLVAGMVHSLLGGTVGGFEWPWQAAPILAALVAYCVVTSAELEAIVPLLHGQPVKPTWPDTVLRGAPGYALAASFAVGLAEVIGRHLWVLAPVVAVPLYAGYRLYRVRAARVDGDLRRLVATDSLDHGVAILDAGGDVTLWNRALERLLDYPRDLALDRPIATALASLGDTPLTRSINDALHGRPHQALVHVAVTQGDDRRTLQVSLLTTGDGLALHWHDVTDRTRAEHALKRREARLTLAADGANDGMWEWDLRTGELHVTARWTALMGMPPSRDASDVSAWMQRVHPDDLVPLRAAIDAHLEGRTPRVEHEHRVLHASGAYRRFLCRAIAARDPNGVALRLAGSFTDTTDRDTAIERIKNAGALDPLTGLGNRTVFVDRVGRRLEALKARSLNGRFAVLYLDLDRFKVVNDSLGHLVGDELLVAVSRRLESCVRDGDALARLGGDEFAILLNELTDDNQANAIAFRIQDTLTAPFSISGRQVFTSVSIGIAFGNAQYAGPEEIMRDADTAMYHAKSRGKARHELFDADMHARELDRFGFENDLRAAVARRDFEVAYQPIVSLATGMCVGFEALIRWTRNGVPTSPATFIPIAEELGLIEPIGTWVLSQACTTFARWQRHFPQAGLECITVNVSSRQLMQQNFPMIVEQAIYDAGLQPCDLRLEITETALLDNPTVAAELLRQLREIGVKIYLDDFGTGHSSLSHLHRLPVDALKIDQSFVKSLLVPDRPAIVESILALARTLNTTVVAEGIETETQAKELERLGCTRAQGYLFSRPLTPRAVEEMLLANEPLGPKRPGRPPVVVTPRTDAEQDYLLSHIDWPDDWLVQPTEPTQRAS